MIHGLLRFAPALAAADRADQQQNQQDSGNSRENPFCSVCDRLRLVQPFRFRLIRRHRLAGGLRRRYQRRLFRYRGLLHIVDDNVIALKLQRLIQLVPAGGDKPEGSGLHLIRQVGVNIPDKGGTLAHGNAVKGVKGDIAGPDGDVLHLHGAVVMNRNKEADLSGTLVNRIPVSGSFHPQRNHLRRVHSGDLEPAGGRFHALAGALVRLHGKLEILGFCNSNVLFKVFRLAGLHFQAFEHGAQHGIRYGDIGKVQGAGILQRQRQLDRISGRSALFVRLQRRVQLHFTVLDRGGIHFLGVALAAGLVGNGSRAGDVLFPHRGGEGVAFRSTHRNGINGAGLCGNSGVFLDVHGIDFHIAGVGHFVGDADFLVLLGRGRYNDPVDGDLRILAEVRDILGVVHLMGLQRRLSVLPDGAVIGGILDGERDLPVVQFFLGNSPVTGPALALSDGKRRGAEIFNLAAIRIIQGYRSRHVSVSHIGDRNGDSDCLRPG